MITKIKIDGFKSFSNFQMEFAPLTVIAGTNASGKSNLFDAMQLLGRMVEMDLKTAFSEQRGDPSELFTLYEDGTSAQEMSFLVEIMVNGSIKDKFGGEETLKYTRLKYELKIKQVRNDRDVLELVVVEEALNPIRHDDDKWVNVYIPKKELEKWRPKVKTGKRGVAYIDTELRDGIVNLRQDGKGGITKKYPLNNITQAIISVVNSVDFPHALAAKEEIRKWYFLQLNPDDLRQPSSYLAKDFLTHSGKNLAAVLHRIGVADPSLLKDITRRLNALLPGISSVSVVDDKIGKQFVVKIKTSDNREYTSRVLSEGTLRLLTLCVFLYDPYYQGLLCFEEPENGVHPARMKLTAELLVDLVTEFENNGELLQRQVIVNTHSPVLVGDIFSLKKKNVHRIWLSQMVTQIKYINGKKRRIQATKMLPVLTEDTQMAFQFTEEEKKITEEEKKMTLASLRSYLENADFEKDLEK